ncbi:hypothetical protein BSZ35_11135 [Salinibacter sp. 10B]|nr:sulfotransferase [Salinibacter sp. 10B]PQJ35075.1 hypothetical protein BSZ35_11135 [Salinibacter sp. 10B]
MSQTRTGCLLVGSPRSGTTLCATMIGSHPDVGMVIEDLGHAGHTIPGVKVWGNKLCIPNQIRLDPIPDDRSLWRRLEDGVRAVIGRPRRRPQFMESYPPPPSQQYTIRTYVEKEAKLVAMIRDPDHVVDSIRRRGPASTVDLAKERWSQAARTISRASEEYPDRTHLVRFVDLVERPKVVMSDICVFLGLPFSLDMIEGHSGARQYEREKIDPSVAHRDVQSYNLDAYDPEAFRAYKKLTQKAAVGSYTNQG